MVDSYRVSALGELPRLKGYELLEEVGHGGMATVYRARDPRLERDVAVKVIHRHLRENAEVAARFTSEARAVAKLRHPNIVEVYDVSREDDNERFLVVELVRGTTLRKLIAEHPDLPAEIAVLLGLEVARALQHAHEHGVVHRDIKPENVLVAWKPLGDARSSSSPQNERLEPRESNKILKGNSASADSSPSNSGLAARDSEPGGAASAAQVPRLKLADFGIAKLLDAQGVTSTGQVLGSPAHMAPEQIEGGAVDERADIFGLGVLLYELLVGKLPFHGRNPAQVLRRVLDGIYEPGVKERPQIGAEWSALLDRALAKEPEARFASVQELIDEATNLLNSLGFTNSDVELAAYFSSPGAYREEHKSRIGKQLTELACSARGAGNVVRASQLFNRALAIKPGDPELLKLVSGLARRAEYKKIGVRVGLILLGSCMLGAIAFWVTRATHAEPIVTAPPPLPEAPASVQAPVITAEPSAALPPVTSAPIATIRRGTRLILPPSKSASPDVGGTRRVQVVLRGAAGTAQVDGKPIRFGQQVELAVGVHQFQFAAADDTCCVAEPAVQAVRVEAGEGIQTVFGQIKIRDATLSVRGGPAGAGVSCPALFAGSLSLPGERKIPMGSNLSVSGSCTLVPPEGSEISAKTQTVRLAAGQTSTLQF